MKNTTKLAKSVSLTSISIAALTVALPQAVLGQSADEEVTELEEVMVTARRRTESIQDVPIAVTVMSGDDIRGLGMRRSSDIGAQAPNVNMVQGNFGLGAPIVSIRGITNADFSAISNTPVNVYADGVVINSIQAQGFALFDTERVELLRGPQGTLFGRNSTSGALQFVSSQPTNEVTGYVSATYGRFDHKSIEGAISGPLIEDKLLARFAMIKNNRDGDRLNRATGKMIGKQDDLGLRFLLTAPDIAGAEAKFKYQYGRSKGEAIPFFNSNGDNTFSPEIEASSAATGYKEITIGLADRPEEITSHQASFELNFGVGDWEVTSISAYLTHDFLELNDDDASLLEIVHQGVKSEQDQFSQELRAAYSSGPLDLILGAFYMKENVKSVGGFPSTDRGVLAALAPVSLGGIVPDEGARLTSFGDNDQDLKSFALFASSIYKVSEQFSFSAGLRWTQDTKDIDQYTAPCNLFQGTGAMDFLDRGNLTPVSPDAPAFAVAPDGSFVSVPASLYGCLSFGNSDGSKTDSVMTGRLSAEYKPNENTLIYLSATRGFKGSSFNGALFSADSDTLVGKETVHAFELGLKTQSSDSMLTFNSAAYYYDYNDFQAFEYTTDPAGNAVQRLFNIPEARLYGVEFELYAMPAPGLNVSLGLGLSKSEIQETGALPFTVSIVKGNEFRNSANLNLNGSISYEIPIGDDHYLVPQVDGFYVGSYFSEFSNHPDSTAGKYGQLNARLSLADADGIWTLTAYAENLTDAVQITGRFPGNISSSGTDFTTVGARRSFGLTFTIGF